MNTSGDRLKALLQECGLTPSDFAAQRGVTPQHVNNWFKRGVPLARLEEIADLFCVQRRWLRSGEGAKHPSPLLRQPLRCPAPVDAPPLSSLREGRQLRIPLHALRDGRLEPLGKRHLRLPAQTLKALGIARKNVIGLTIPSASMAPVIPSDAILAIDRSLTQVIDGETYALLHNGKLRVHRLSLGHHDTLYLHNHTLERYTPSQRQAQGMVILGWVFHWSCFSQQRPV
ncbi:transcriptional regulator [Pseudomonas sp. S 311-6]|uniref:LexA family transcriptional regulator n=1 Tax=Pseudomonas TaxID=286 RepID=UPI0020982067|nr:MULTISPECIES: S24 family peptidase [Pseudomonas]MCO7566595.1 transcriptional regulator [Pseudomonas mosselii]MCO7619493.1 transcriptional regulator [Pseudomonas guariconensis]MCO7641381.1 transcriptional regulator [Pseudomonas sp. S 311-6]